MNEDNYLKESIIKCVDYAMKQNDDGKRRIFTELFKYCDTLVNEDILVTCLKDEQKREWLHNELIDNLQARIDKAIEQINWLGKCIEEDEGISWQVEYCDEIVDILKGSDTNE